MHIITLLFSCISVLALQPMNDPICGDNPVVKESEDACDQTVQSMSNPIANIRKVDIVIEATSNLTNMFSSQSECITQISNLVAAANVEFRRDLNIEINIASIIANTSPVSWETECQDMDHNGVIDTNDFFTCFKRHWSQIPPSTPVRDIVMWMSSPVGYAPAGQAAIGGMCYPSTQYARMIFKKQVVINPNIAPVNNIDMYLQLFIHEVGHVLGGSHPSGTPVELSAHCTYSSSTPEDDWATIMGACHGLVCFDQANKNAINCLFDDRFACETIVPINIYGDYNHDATITSSDIDMCRLCLQWKNEYEFEACKQIFDINQDSQLDACDCNILQYNLTGVQVDCDNNGIPDGCAQDTFADCNHNGRDDVCERTSSTDCNNNQILDTCEPMNITLSYSGGRTIPVAFPNLCGTDFYIQIDDYINPTYYVDSNKGIGSTAYITNATTWGSFHIKGTQIKPSTGYIVAVKQFNNTGSLIESVITTSKWGDINNDNLVNMDDYTCMNECFVGNFSHCSKQACDIAPAIPDNVINLTDILAVINAIGGTPYPY